MFKLFNKKNETDFENKKELIAKIFSLLPDKFINIKNQIEEGIFTGIKRERSKYIKFSFRTDILNKYEDKLGKCFEIRGVKVFDKNIQNYTEVHLAIVYGIFFGYSIPNIKELNPDISKIDTTRYWIKNFENIEYESIKKYLVKEELELINPNDVYEIELDGILYYHLKDIGDGDFVGMDEIGKLFKITHDPFQVIEIKNRLSALLK